MRIIILSFLLCVGFWKYSDAQWVRVINGIGYPNIDVYSFAVNGNNLFAGTNFGVYLSTNNGTTWTQTALNNRGVYSLAVNGNNVFAGTYNFPPYYGVYLSTNNGTTWTQTALNNRGVYSLAVNGNNVFAGTVTYGVYLSTDNGTSWTQTSLNNLSINSLVVIGNNVFAGIGNLIPNGVYKSTDNGTNWTQTALNNRYVYSLTVYGNNFFAGTYNFGVYLSTDNGTIWAQTSLNNQYVRSLALNGNSVIAGTYLNGVYVSNNNGGSWTQRNESLPISNYYNSTVFALSILNNYIFAGTDSGGVYRRPLSEITAIQTISNEIPNQFSLSQNYPNPFNPKTKIKFAVSSAAWTFLSVYDALGREVAALVNEQLKPGTYETDWDASNEPSGVYYYKLTAGDFTETNSAFVATRKMVLVK